MFLDDVILLVKSSKDQAAARLALTSAEYGLSADQVPPVHSTVRIFHSHLFLLFPHLYCFFFFFLIYFLIFVIPFNSTQSVPSYYIIFYTLSRKSSFFYTADIWQLSDHLLMSCTHRWCLFDALHLHLPSHHSPHISPFSSLIFFILHYTLKLTLSSSLLWFWNLTGWGDPRSASW